MPYRHKQKSKINQYQLQMAEVLPIWKKWLWQPGPVLHLEKGEATIRFWVRDAEAKQAPFLDVLCLTNCPSYDPTDKDARKSIEQLKGKQ